MSILNARDVDVDNLIVYTIPGHKNKEGFDFSLRYKYPDDSEDLLRVYAPTMLDTYGTTQYAGDNKPITSETKYGMTLGAKVVEVAPEGYVPDLTFESREKGQRVAVLRQREFKWDEQMAESASRERPISDAHKQSIIEFYNMLERVEVAVVKSAYPNVVKEKCEMSSVNRIIRSGKTSKYADIHLKIAQGQEPKNPQKPELPRKLCTRCGVVRVKPNELGEVVQENIDFNDYIGMSLGARVAPICKFTSVYLSTTTKVMSLRLITDTIVVKAEGDDPKNRVEKRVIDLAKLPDDEMPESTPTKKPRVEYEEFEDYPGGE